MTLALGSNDNDRDVVETMDDYVVTSTQNYISRHATLHNASQIDIKGRCIIAAQVTMMEDDTTIFAPIRVGRYSVIESGTKIIPPSMPYDDNKRVPVVIGAHTHIGRNCDIQAAAIGSCSVVQDGVRLGPRVLIKDCCWIDTHVTLPADTVVPPFTRLSVAPLPALQWTAPYCIELPPTTPHLRQASMVQQFQLSVQRLQQHPSTKS